MKSERSYFFADVSHSHQVIDISKTVDSYGTVMTVAGYRYSVPNVVIIEPPALNQAVRNLPNIKIVYSPTTYYYVDVIRF